MSEHLVKLQPHLRCALIYFPYPLYTGAATSVPPLCDHKIGQVAVEGRREAERLPWSFSGGTQDVQTSPWTPWSPWNFEHVQNSRTKVAEEVGRSHVAQRRQDEGTHTAVVAEWMHSGRPLVTQIKNANIVYRFEQHVCLPCTTIVPPLADQWRPLSDHCGDHCDSIQRPRQHLSHHGNDFAFTLPSLRDLLCHYNSFGRSRKAQGSCCSSYKETELSGFRRPLSVLTIFMVAQRWHEGRSPV